MCTIQPVLYLQSENKYPSRLKSMDLSMTGSEHCGRQAFNFNGKGEAGGKFSSLCGCPYKK